MDQTITCDRARRHDLRRLIANTSQRPTAGRSEVRVSNPPVVREFKPTEATTILTEQEHRFAAVVMGQFEGPVLCFSRRTAMLDGPSVADFYAGKTITIIVGYAPGGGYDTTARVLSKYLGSHIPGNPTVTLVSMPGAGGIQSVDFVANVAPKDGTAIGEILSPAILVPMMQKVRYDPTRLLWLGSLTARPGVVVNAPA